MIDEPPEDDEPPDDDELVEVDEVMDPETYALEKRPGYFPASMRINKGASGSRPAFSADDEYTKEQSAKGNEAQKARRDALKSLKDREELAREEGYQDALTDLMPRLLAQDNAIVQMMDDLLSGEADLTDKEVRNAFRALSTERKQIIDRIYGTAKQRKDETKQVLNVSVDLHEILKGRDA